MVGDVGARCQKRQRHFRDGLRNQPARLREQSLPLSTRVYAFRTRSPFTALRLCEETALVYNCSRVALNASLGAKTPAWPCSDPDASTRASGSGTSKWSAECSGALQKSSE